MVNVAILGHGVVGSGVAEILINKPQKIAAAVGEELNVKYILDLREFPELSYCDKFTKNFDEIVNDSSVKVVAEMMGGVNPAYDFVKRCLESGKSVVTSNKELVAKKGAELIKIAKEKNCNFLFEASVGGGIPVIRPLTQCLLANEICSIKGILNGTSNYILNKMITDHVSMETALKEAQELGYAEKDPSADIDGDDACRKICILATLAYGKHIYPDWVTTEGIRDITLDDVAYAHDYNCVIKLIGKVSKCDCGKIFISVAPTLVKKSDPISSVHGVFNAVTVTGDETGDVMFYGKGAGKAPTASAVVADIIDCAKHLEKRRNIDWENGTEDFIANPLDEKCACYIKVATNDKAAALDEIMSTFSVEKVLSRDNQPENEIAFITNATALNEINSKTSSLKNCLLKNKLRILN